MTTSTHPVSVIGLGAMGSAVARALLRAGRPTTVWNRTPARAQALAADGARVAATPAEALRGSALTIVSLTDAAAVRAVLAPAAEALGGAVVVDATTGSPAGARAWASWLAERGAAPIDAAILGVPDAVGTDDALVLAAGDAAAFGRAEPALAALGRTVRLGADPGLASGLDVALQSAMYGAYAGAQHAVAVAASVGADEPLVRELLAPWLEGVAGFVVEAASAAGEVPAELGPAQQARVVSHLLAASAEQGVDEALTGHLRTSLALMRRASAAA